MAGILATLLAVLLWSFHATAGELSVREVSALQLILPFSGLQLELGKVVKLERLGDVCFLQL